MRTTLPAAPRSVTYSSNDSWVIKHATGTDLVRRLVWTVPATEGTPDAATKFDSRVILSTKSRISPQRAPPFDSGERIPLSATVSYAIASVFPPMTVADGDTSSGIEVKAEHDTDMDSSARPVRPAAGTYYFYACVRADPDLIRCRLGASTMGPGRSAQQSHSPGRLRPLRALVPHQEKQRATTDIHGNREMERRHGCGHVCS